MNYDKNKLSEENKNLIKKHLTKEDFNKIEKEFIKWREERMDTINNENCDQFSLYESLEIQELEFKDVCIEIEKLRDSNEINFIFTAGYGNRKGVFFKVIKISDVDFSNDNIELPKDYKNIVKEWLEEELNKSSTWKLISKILLNSTRELLEKEFLICQKEAIKELEKEIEDIEFKRRDNEDKFTKNYIEREIEKIKFTIWRMQIDDFTNSRVFFSLKENHLEIAFVGKKVDFRTKTFLPYEYIIENWIETKEK